MNIEEKALALADYCEERNCQECKIYPHTQNLAMSCFTNDAEIELCYAIVFGEKSATKTEENTSIYPTSKLNRHAMICDEIKELYKKKNADYGDSFHTTFIEEGMAMSRIRLTDKLERFKRLTKSNEQNVKDESIRDTLIDLANYAIMTILELEGESNE